ncbi:MAG: hypothetical protein KFF77_06250, partial [Bacteroidetes bacterium]|nr:hypothetical protein [Bacteroidota bacterium]
MTKKRHPVSSAPRSAGRTGAAVLIGGGVLFVLAIVYAIGGFSWLSDDGRATTRDERPHGTTDIPSEKWLQR